MGGNFFRRKAVLPKNKEVLLDETSLSPHRKFMDSRKPSILKPRKKDQTKARIPAPIVSRLPDRNPKSKIRMAVIGRA